MRVLLLGAGEHAAVVAETAVLLGHEVLGAVAPAGAAARVAVLGDDAALAARPAWAADSSWHLAVGELPLRRRLAERWAAHDAWATLVHPTAWVSPSARLGRGVFVGPQALVHAHAVIGDHAIINSAAVVEHDVVVGTGCHLAPGAVVGGGARLGAWAFIGLGARVRDHITVGAGAVVGMGAAVLREVPPRSTVLGVPARERGA